jgi:cell division septation protein DedD
VTSGGYTTVSIGAFSNKDKATSVLSELKKSYRDCYIRRL